MTAVVGLTWGHLHVGDTVRGADQRVWVICERRPGPSWVVGGEEAEYVLRLGAREVPVRRRLSEPAPAVAVADHRAKAAAAGAIYAAFPDTRFVEETLVEETAVIMVGTEHAAAPTIPAPAAPIVCEHPTDKRSTLKSGKVKCTRCKTYPPELQNVPGAPQAGVTAPLAPDGGTGGGALLTGASTPTNPAEVPLGGTVTVGGIVFTKIGEDPFAAPEGIKRAILLDGGGDALLPSAPTLVVPSVDPFATPTQPKRRDAPTGQWGWYKLPDPLTGEPDKLYPRVSTIAKTLADEYGLTLWKQRMVAKGTALRPDLIASAAAADPDTDKRVLDDIVKAAMETAEASRGANYGTAVHKFAERLDDGESIASMRVPAELVPVVERYAALLKAAGLTVLPEYSERVVVNPEYGYAGRIDRIVRDRTGTLRILDVKTGADVIEYGGLEVGTAQAMYAHALFMAKPDFTGYERTWPDVDEDKSLILHLPIRGEGGQIYGLNIAKGWRAARVAFEARALRSDARDGWLWAYSPGTPADAVRLRIDRATRLDELGAAVTNAQRIGAWTPELEARALARYDLIRAVMADTREDLAALWAELHPAGRWTQEVSDTADIRMSQINELATATV